MPNDPGGWTLLRPAQAESWTPKFRWQIPSGRRVSVASILGEVWPDIWHWCHSLTVADENYFTIMKIVEARLHLVLAFMGGEQLLQDSLLRLTGCSRVTGAWRHDRASDWGAVAALYSRMGSPFFFLPDIDVQFHFFHGIDELSLEEKKRRHFISEKKVGGPGDVVWIDIVWNGSVFWEVSWQQLGSRLLYRCQFGLSCGNVSIKSFMCYSELSILLLFYIHHELKSYFDN